MSSTRIDRAMDKLRDEMAASTDNGGIGEIGDYLTERLQREPVIAEKVLTDGITIKGAFEAIRDYAKKNQKGGFCYVPPEKAYEIVCGYYGIAAPASVPERKASGSGSELDLDALLGL